jgi:flagellar basal body P-ring formation protein FlgA
MPSKSKNNCIILRWSTIFLLATVLYPFAVFGNANITIQMRTTATVGNDVVCLGDVSDIESTDQSKIQELSGIEIADAPLAGQSRWIHANEIKVRLKQAGLDGQQYRLLDSGPVKVLRRYATVAPARINAAVKAFVLHHAPWKPDQLKVYKFTLDQELTVPPGIVAFQVTAPKHTDWLGPIPFNVLVIVDGQAVRKVTAPATIEVWSDVVIAAKPLGKFQPIHADDILIKKMNLARVPANVIASAEQVLGRRANRNIAANSILRSDQVEMAPVIKRGDVVQVIAESEVLKVTAKGLAKENGAKGDRIQVMNLGSKKIIYALVVDGQTVQVEF